MNRGALLLEQAIRAQETTHAAVGKIIGASESHVWRIAHADRIPNRLHALGLRDHFGIPLEAWDEAVEAPESGPGRVDTVPSPPPASTGTDGE